MQTPEFKLKPLHTLGIFLACSALIAGCAGNSVKPMSTDTGQISSPQVEGKTLANNDSGSKEQTAASTASPVVSDDSKPFAETNNTTTQSDSPKPDNSAADMTAQAPTQTASTTQEPAPTTFYFGINKTNLTDQDKTVLLQHARFLEANPELVLEINGHTDATGPHAYNEYLSKRRAEAVAKVLINAGVTRSQLVINALADNKPLPDQSDPGKNRRVELQYDDMSMVSSK